MKPLNFNTRFENSSVNITDSNTQDIENLFNLIFQK